LSQITFSFFFLSFRNDHSQVAREHFSAKIVLVKEQTPSIDPLLSIKAWVVPRVKASNQRTNGAPITLDLGMTPIREA
jgi:hypothetical protein